MFDVTTEKYNGVEFHFIKYEKFTTRLKDYLDESLSTIYKGDFTRDIEVVKNMLRKFFLNKAKSTTLYGSIAELLIHLFLKNQGALQLSLFGNLEEIRTIKKGFDGYYLHKNIEWIMESKSSKSSTKGVTHLKNIKESHSDIEMKINGSRPEINPWENAYNHVRLIEIDIDKSIYNNLKRMSDLYEKDVFQEIEKYNIINSSTIGFKSNENIFDKFSVNDFDNFIAQSKFKDMIIICIEHKIIVDILRYFNIENGDTYE
ncbi:hypothetical protein HF295_07630 [Hujiaoplasma nucleasis]|uniref:DUF1837 domain-containing protein n=1 Tax=Hujiaoplasma nucleasis TaxID=2725268 RepID=A0A7L6N375_9MOLU|nr:hypothetical protein [Hujiaoplasma nucleasis]QLY40726.1 hypothetical protein HF295_07630 [Hujiaoplasma nucleasis]